MDQGVRLFKVSSLAEELFYEVGIVFLRAPLLLLLLSLLAIRSG